MFAIKQVQEFADRQSTGYLPSSEYRDQAMAIAEGGLLCIGETWSFSTKYFGDNQAVQESFGVDLGTPDYDMIDKDGWRVRVFKTKFEKISLCYTVYERLGVDGFFLIHSDDPRFNPFQISVVL